MGDKMDMVDEMEMRRIGPLCPLCPQCPFILVLILFLVPGSVLFTGAQAEAAQNQTKANYEIYALSYGIYPGFPVSGLLAGADKDRKIDLQMMVWLLKGPGGR